MSTVAPVMTLPSGAALGRVLSEFTWRVARAEAHTLPASTGVTAASADVVFVYVVSGRARTHAMPADVADAVTLGPGDLQITRHPALHVRAERDAQVVVATIEALRGGSALRTLPSTITVRSFDRSEPAIARLAGSFGCPDVPLPDPTDRVVCSHMATTVIAAALRAWAMEDAAAAQWLARSADPFLARVIDAIHAEPGRAWTLDDLATLGAMGRSAFAERFRASVGMAPLRYLTGVRVAEAKRHLADDQLTVAQTARMLGYASEEGFSRAFRRHTGSTPSAWRASQLSAQAG